MLPIRRQGWVGRRAGPERESVMVLGSEHHIFRACLMENFGPSFGIPLLDLPIEIGGEVVIIVLGPIVFAVIRLRG